jgi:hypothetical protein
MQIKKRPVTANIVGPRSRSDSERRAMPTSKVYRRAVQLMAACAFVLTVVLPRSALAQPQGIDPQAEKLLKASLSYLAAQKRFGVTVRTCRASS